MATMLTTTLTWGQTSSTTRWTGHDIGEQGLISATGTEVLLYNVGTGRFIMHGGDWGTQARLFYEDTGKKLILKYGQAGTNIIFDTGMATRGLTALGANVPNVTSGYSWGNNGEGTFTLLLDGQDKIDSGSEIGKYRDMKFTRVNTNDGTYTYYIHEEFGGGTETYYLIRYSTSSGGVTTYHYLKGDGSLTTNETEATHWYTDDDGIYYVQNGSKYYIKYNNGSYSTSTGTNCSISNNYIRYRYNQTYQYNLGINSSNELTFIRTNVSQSSYIAYLSTSSQTGTVSPDSYYWGAVYGENHGDQDGDANGTMVRLSSSFDKATWSTQVPGEFKVAYESTIPSSHGVANGDIEVPIFNADTKVSLDELYQWRIVTIADVLATVTDEQEVSDGLTTNLTYLVNDRGFERNDWSFFYGDEASTISSTTKDDGWNVNRLSDVTYSTEGNGRYKYTWGYLNITQENQDGLVNNQSGTRTIRNESWKVPVRLKAQWNNKPDAKFGFLEFEGVGSATTYITAPADGYYLITGYGFYQGGHPGYLYASTTAPGSWTASNVEQGKVLKSVSGFDKSSSGSVTTSGQTVTSATGVKGAGADFVYNKDSYYVEMEVYARAGQPIYFGVGKTGATQVSGSGSYYYDSDWVGADQFQIYYLGEDHPVVFDEMKTDVSYLKDGNNDKNYKNRSVRLKRTFTKGEWNSFVFPLDLTAVQIRNAFGSTARLAKLADFGEKSRSNTCIDFVTVSLPAEGAALEADQFYLIMPTVDGTLSGTGEDAYIYYPMGGNFYFTTANEDVSADGKTYTSLTKEGGWASGSTGAWDPVVSDVVYDVASGLEDNGNRIQSYATYVSSGENTSVPAGSYVLRQGDMYHTQSDMKIKGFRGWLREAATSNSVTIRINGIEEDIDPATIIEGFQADEEAPIVNGVYDLTGRRVIVEDMNALPKGLYIVNGKKVYVK